MRIRLASRLANCFVRETSRRGCDGGAQGGCWARSIETRYGECDQESGKRNATASGLVPKTCQCRSLACTTVPSYIHLSLK